MANDKKNCKVCDKPFTPCKDTGYGFNWRVMCCSPTCGQKYLQRILDSRKVDVPKAPVLDEIDAVEDDGSLYETLGETEPEVEQGKPKRTRGWRFSEEDITE